MTDRADKIMELLEIAHPDAHCELNYSTDFELLVAVILSAQCTDKRVNIRCVRRIRDSGGHARFPSGASSRIIGQTDSRRSGKRPY